MSKQKINKRRRQICQDIINKDRPHPLTVRAAFMNGSLPHGVALAWVGERDAYLVNLKKRTAREYVREGKFLMKRLLLPLRIWVSKNTDGQTYEDLVKEGILKPVGLNECPGCVNDGWGLSHNQFCDSLKDTEPMRELESQYSGEKDQYFD